MQFSLATAEDNKKVLSNATKVKVHLTTGIIEVLDKHQDLLGKVSIDLLEVESNDDNKTERFKFILQDGLVIVSNKGLSVDVPQTGVYIFAKRIVELNAGLSVDALAKKVELKLAKLEVEKQILVEATALGAKLGKIKTRILMMEEELEFEKKVLALIKDSKN